jgi:hypothetical protein
MTSKVLAVLGWESGWEDARAHFKKGPPPFMRPGWVSPLVGQKVDLSILDNPSDVEWIKGDASGRNEVRVVIVEFWAALVFSYCISLRTTMLTTSSFVIGGVQYVCFAQRKRQPSHPFI